jgi:hypothetical protein
MGVPVNEQETTITFSRDSDKAVIWTSDTTVMTKLDKFSESKDSPDWKCTHVSKIMGTDEIADKEYEVKKRLISFRSAVPAAREMTDEERAAAAERFRKYRENARNAGGNTEA